MRVPSKRGRMFFAYYLHDLSPHLLKITDKIAVHWYGLAYVLGFYLTYRVMLFLSKRGLCEDQAGRGGGLHHDGVALRPRAGRPAGLHAAVQL
jgi:hypothetical protein